MQIELATSVSGHYTKIEILDNRGQLVRELSGFRNLVLDAGLTRLSSSDLSNSPVYNFCRVGSGTAEPLPSDTSLQAHVASASTTTGVVGRDIVAGFSFHRLTYTFALGAAAGNISEIGTGWAASGNGTLFSRARIKDAAGNPTSITILSDEILRVTWEFRIYWPTGDTTGSLANAGNKGGSYAWKARASQVGQWQPRPQTTVNGIGLMPFVNNSNLFGGYQYYTGGGIGAITEAPSGVSGPAQGGMGIKDVIGTMGKSTATLTFSTTQGNTSGIKCVKFGQIDVLQYQVEFTPPLIKTSEDLMEITVAHSWGRR